MVDIDPAKKDCIIQHHRHMFWSSQDGLQTLQHGGYKIESYMMLEPGRLRGQSDKEHQTVHTVLQGTIPDKPSILQGEDSTTNTVTIVLLSVSV